MRRGKARPWDSMYEPWWIPAVIMIVTSGLVAGVAYWYINKQLGP